MIEVPHFASLRGREREITILRSDSGDIWREHTMQATEEAVHEALNGSFTGSDNNSWSDFCFNRYDERSNILINRYRKCGGTRIEEGREDIDGRFPAIFCHRDEMQARSLHCWSRGRHFKLHCSPTGSSGFPSWSSA